MIALDKIKPYLENSSNPLIFFDDDADGLSSFLLIYKFIDKGKGIPIKHRILDDSYLKSVEEAGELEYCDSMTYCLNFETKYGTRIYNPKTNGAEDRVRISIPDQQVKAKVTIKNS